MSERAEIDFRCWTAAQAYAQAAFLRSEITFLLGPAGCGKTTTAMALALKFVQQYGGRLVLTRPLVECGEQLGFMPGDLAEKMGVWLGPIRDALQVLTHTKPEAILASQVELVPLAYARGRTFRKCVAILDEAQNCTYQQLKMWLTRLGDKCKMIVCGDPSQSDLADAINPLQLAVQRLRDCPQVEAIQFEEADIVRHPLVKEMLQRL